MSNRTSHAAAADKGRLFLFGGYDAEGTALNDLWVLRVGAATWARPVPTGQAPPLTPPASVEVRLQV